jgi:hypothetical protein
MSKKTVKRIWIVLLIIAIIGVFVSVIISFLGVVVIGRSDKYVDDYNEYYICKKKVSFQGFMTGYHGYKVWFALGQKEKLLEKVNEEIITELDRIKEVNSDILKSYEIINDFETIIYHYVGADEGLYDLNGGGYTEIEIKVEFYRQIFYDDRNVSCNGVKFQSPSGEITS